MKRKQIFSVATIGLLSLLLVAGAAVAAVFPEDNTFTGTVNQFEKGIKIGKQGTGGVTFFNGTIVNQTTTDGADNPVTFGDNVRIDGRLQRGHNRPNDTWKVQIDDGLEVWKDLEVSGSTTLEGNATLKGTTTHEGKADFQGGIEWAERTGSIMVPPASFEEFVEPIPSPAIFCSHSLAIGLTCGGTATVWMVNAPLELPHNTTLKKVTLHASDISSNHELHLYIIKRKANDVPAFAAVSNLSFIEQIDIAKLSTGYSYSGGYKELSVDLNERIDNSVDAPNLYEFGVIFGKLDASGAPLPTSGELRYLGAKLDYTYTEPY